MKRLLLAILLAVTGFSTVSATDFGLDCMFGTEKEWEEEQVGLGSSTDDFIGVFGELEDESQTEWIIEDCGTIIVSHTDHGHITSISVFPPENGGFTVGQAQLIARLFIPEDAESIRDDFIDGTGFVYIMRSETLLNSLPIDTWEYVDNTPEPGAFSAIYWIGMDNPEPGQFQAVFIDLEVED